MKNLSIFQKILIIIAFLFLAFYVFDTCKNGKIQYNTKSDTFYVKGKDTVIWQRPTFTGSETIIKSIPQYIEIKGKDSVIYKYIDTNNITKKDYEYLYNVYTSKNYFVDQLVLPDSAGIIAITDTISANEVTGRSYRAQLNTKIIKETTTIIQPKRTIGFLGVNLGGSENGFRKAGIDLNLKLKNDNLYRVGVYRDFRTDEFVYEAGYAFPIRFGNKNK